MGLTSAGLTDVAGLIHTAVAPIFLLMAVATTLMVLATRLARIVDRGRYLQRNPEPDSARQREELSGLERRARLIYRALALGVSAALCVCLAMTLSFAGPLLGREPGKLVAFTFLIALFAYTGALVCLLKEVFLAVASFSLGLHRDS